VAQQQLLFNVFNLKTKAVYVATFGDSSANQSFLAITCIKVGLKRLPVIAQLPEKKSDERLFFRLKHNIPEVKWERRPFSFLCQRFYGFISVFPYLFL
jgi:hypothetical protein